MNSGTRTSTAPARWGAGGLKKAKLWAVVRKSLPPDELGAVETAETSRVWAATGERAFYNQGYETGLGGCRYRCGERDTFARAGSPAVSGCGCPPRSTKGGCAESDAGTGRRQTGSGAGDDIRA